MTRSRILKAFAVAAALPLLYLGTRRPTHAAGLTLVREAHAIVGAPLTPVSVAGVARRTTARTVAAGAATSATCAAAGRHRATAAGHGPATGRHGATAGATAQQQAAAARPPGAPAAGAVVNALPAGCKPETKSGVEYQNCGGVCTARPSRATIWSMLCNSRQARRRLSTGDDDEIRISAARKRLCVGRHDHGPGRHGRCRRPRRRCRQTGAGRHARRGRAGVGAVDPGINQPGRAGNVGVDPGINARPRRQRGCGCTGCRRRRAGRRVVDPGLNQPGVAGNVGGVARRSGRSVTRGAAPIRCR